MSYEDMDGALLHDATPTASALDAAVGFEEDDFMGDPDGAFAIAEMADSTDLAGEDVTYSAAPAPASLAALSLTQAFSPPTFSPAGDDTAWDVQPPESDDQPTDTFHPFGDVSPFSPAPLAAPFALGDLESTDVDAESAVHDPFSWAPVSEPSPTSLAEPDGVETFMSVDASAEQDDAEPERVAEDPDPELREVPQLMAVEAAAASDHADEARPSRFSGRSKKDDEVIEIGDGPSPKRTKARTPKAPKMPKAAKTPKSPKATSDASSVFAKVDKDERTDHVSDPRWTAVLRVLATASLIVGLGLGAYTVFNTKSPAKQPAPRPTTAATTAVPTANAPTTAVPADSVPVAADGGEVTFDAPGDYTVQ